MMKNPTTTTITRLSLCLAVVLLLQSSSTSTTQAFVPQLVPPSCRQGTLATRSTTRRFVSSDLERPTPVDQDEDVIANKDTNKAATLVGFNNKNSIPKTLRIQGQGIPSRQERVQLLDSSTYEKNLIDSWETADLAGFDWEIEKLRRWAAGLRMRDDGSWVKQPALFDFLVSPSKVVDDPSATRGPRPAGMSDSFKVFGAQFLTSLGFGPALGMAAIPTAVIQKYEGSWFDFIKGVLGGDLQTLAGGPLFLLLAKYFHEYGPIFNLSL